MSTAPGPSRVSVVIPYYQEPDWLPVALADLERAIAAAALPAVEILVVDDGSPEPPEPAIAASGIATPVRVIHQENRGRFEARRAGIEAAAHDLVLLIDSRVSLRPDALRFAMERIAGGASPVWNAHVDIDVTRNPFARFWDVLTQESYAHYFRDPRTVCFTLEDFDAFPKGTTCFLAPRASLLDAYAAFTTRYDDIALANDDTPIIRFLADRHGVCISPQFSCVYRSRDALRPFVRHAFHRGTVFVDGHAVRGGRFLPVIVGFYPASAAVALVLWRRPRFGATGVALAPLTAAAFAVSRRRSPADAAALAGLCLPWLAAFTAGMWRGLWLMLRSAGGSRRSPASRR